MDSKSDYRRNILSGVALLSGLVILGIAGNKLWRGYKTIRELEKVKKDMYLTRNKTGPTYFRN